MKRPVAKLFAALLAVAIIAAGCGGSDSPDQADASADTDQSAQAAPTTAPTSWAST